MSQQEHENVAAAVACIFFPLCFIGLCGAHGPAAVWAWVEV